MKRDSSVTLFQYWNRLRDGRPAPLRTEIEPAEIKSLLGDTFILEADSNGAPVFRLAGTRLCAIYGRELKGHAFPELWRANDRETINRFVAGVFEKKSLMILTYSGLTRSNRRLPMEMLLLPLEGGPDNQRALGIITPESKPYWLGADPFVDAQIETMRLADPDRDALLIEASANASFATSNRFDLCLPASGLPGARRIRHLMVLQGGKLQ